MVADQYIQTQLGKGYMAGPFSRSECAKVITSSIAVIPKKTVGKWRVIVDMSRPRGASVNDNLRRGLTHIAFSSVEDAAHLMHYRSPSTLLAKMDVSEAYRLVPIHPEDHIFLGIQWQDASYVDCQLPSAPAIFSALSEALEWILRKHGVRAVIHYMDDFLLVRAPSTAECSQALATTIATCEEIGVPLAVDKTEGPATELSFLGIQLNSREMRTSLPPDKLAKLRTMVKELVGARVVRDRQQLESLVGHLVHAATVFPLGKAFLNALFATKAAIKPGPSQPGSPLGAGLVGPTARTLAWFIGAPIPALKSSPISIYSQMQQDPGVVVHGQRHTGSRYSGTGSGACRRSP